MARKTESAKSKSTRRTIEAPVVGTTRLPPPVRDELVHPDPAPLHQISKDTAAEAALARAESLLGKGRFGAALREADLIEFGDAALAGQYEFLRQEKLSRGRIGIAERYFLRGDRDAGRRFYERALRPDTSDPAIRELAEVAGRTYDDLANRRRDLIRGLKMDIREDRYAQWCGRRKTLTDLTILDIGLVRDRILPDFRLEEVFGERPPMNPDSGYLDPLPAETDFAALPSGVPGAVFRAAGSAVDVDTALPTLADAQDGRILASLAMPIVANVFSAKLGLFALDEGLSVTGQADGVVPLFRYEYLRDKAKELIAQIQRIEDRMLPIQFELDDFAELADAVRRPLVALEAELEAVKQRISELTQTLAQLVQAEQALEQVVVAIEKVGEECECGWYCWLVTAAGILATAFLITLAMAAAFALLPAGPITAAILYGIAFPAAGLVSYWWTKLTYETFTCENIDSVSTSMRAALDGVRGAISETEAELHHALMTRDVLIAKINALSQQLAAIYQSNAARLLDAKTLDAIQAQYNMLRQSLLTRAQAVGRLAQEAFNFERDAEARLIRDAYYDPERQGYTAAETLLHDLGGLDHIDLTGRTCKAIQLCQMVSLRKHNPMSFIALTGTGRGRFTTELRDFDRWYPGTYLQRIKEVRVEVLVDGTPAPARGYLSNDGVSLVRYVDPQNRRKVDGVRVFEEPDPDLAMLCYKRLQRRRHVDTMAFPEFASHLHDERMRQLQERERNYFENVGLESTWLVELLPDQPFDLSRVTDVRVWFQYEALFDENLKRVLEQKRYVGRREMVALPIGRSIRERGEAVDFTEVLTVKTTRALFDAPAIEKKIVDAGFAIRLKDQDLLAGSAELEVAFEGAPAAALTTGDEGVVATAPDHPMGTGLTELAAMVQDKSVDGTWTVALQSLPDNLNVDDVDEIFLLLNCEYVT